MHFFCSTLKHQLNTDIIHENGTCILMPFQCHQEI